MSYLGQVFEGLTNKIQSFQRFQNFPRFGVFLRTYRAKTKRRKPRKVPNLVECRAILLQCDFWNYCLCFFFEGASLDWFYITSWHFWPFGQIDLAIKYFENLPQFSILLLKIIKKPQSFPDNCLDILQSVFHFWGQMISPTKLPNEWCQGRNSKTMPLTYFWSICSCESLDFIAN